jgi:hypothetical protein
LDWPVNSHFCKSRIIVKEEQAILFRLLKKAAQRLSRLRRIDTPHCHQLISAWGENIAPLEWESKQGIKLKGQ